MTLEELKVYQMSMDLGEEVMGYCNKMGVLLIDLLNAVLNYRQNI